MSEMRKLVIESTASEYESVEVQGKDAHLPATESQIVAPQSTMVELLSTALRDENLSIESHKRWPKDNPDSKQETILVHKSNPTILEVANLFTL